MSMTAAHCCLWQAQVSIGSDAVYAAEEYLASGRQRTGQSAIEQISWVHQHLTAAALLLCLCQAPSDAMPLCAQIGLPTASADA
jgi:hypothetical protein